MPAASDLERRLRGAGLPVTRPRTAVLSAVHDHPHADTESLLRAVHRDHGDVSHQAVYDVLRALIDTGLVRRIQPGFAIDEAEVIYWGQCPRCRNAPAPSPTSPSDAHPEQERQS